MFFYQQVLCKALGLELTSLTPGTLLKDFDKINKILKMPSMAPSVGQQVWVHQSSLSYLKSNSDFIDQNSVQIDHKHKRNQIRAKFFQN